jgi:lipopolysaccharide export system protein LptC
MSTASPALGPAPSKHKAAAPTQPWHWRWRRAAGHYLPVILMALLAASTWWLVKNSIPAARTPESAPPKHEPDYEMRGFRLERYQANGQPKAQISGQLVRHYPDTDTLEIDQVKLRSIGPDGHTTTATAQKAVAQGDGSEVELIGNAQVTRASLGPHDAVIQFRSNYLRVYIDRPSRHHEARQSNLPSWRHDLHPQQWQHRMERTRPCCVFGSLAPAASTKA